MTLIYRGPAILRGFDDDVRKHLRVELEQRGIRVVTERTITAIEKSGAHYSVHVSDGNHVPADQVMFATGRVPNIGKLGLEAAGVTLAKNGGIAVDDYSKTSAPGIYAVGDVTNRINLTPVAIREGHAFADSVFGGKPTKVDHTNVATAVFSEPEVGVVGLTEAEARARLPRTDIYKASFRPMKATLSGRATSVLMKLVVDGMTDQGGRLPCGRRRGRRNGPARRRRDQDGGHQGRLRRHRGAAPDRCRRACHHAQKDRELRSRSRGIGVFAGFSRLSRPRPGVYKSANCSPSS